MIMCDYVTLVAMETTDLVKGAVLSRIPAGKSNEFVRFIRISDNSTSRLERSLEADTC